MAIKSFLYDVFEKLIALAIILWFVALMILGLGIIVVSGIFLFVSPTILGKFISLLALIASIFIATIIFQFAFRLLGD